MDSLGEMAGAAMDAVDAAAEDNGEYVDQGEDYNEPTLEKGSHSAMGSVFLMCLGFILFPMACILLGWNEKNVMCEGRIILQAQEDSEIGSCEDPSNVEGKLAFFSCRVDASNLTVFTPLTSFNMPGLGESVAITSAAASQKIEMYQCIEEKKIDSTEESNSDDAGSLGASLLVRSGRSKTTTSRSSTDDDESSTYQYRMGWSDQHFDSAAFKGTPENIDANGCPDFIYNGHINHNPPLPDRGDGSPVSLGTQTVHGTSIKAGAYTVTDEEALKAIRPESGVSLAPFRGHFTLPEGTDNIISEVKRSSVTVHSGQDTYLGSCRSERLGCIRISYQDASELTHVSVMAKVGASGNTEPFPLDAAWGCPDRDFVRLYPGEMSKEDFIDRLKTDLGVEKWIYRIIGLAMAWLAVWCCFEPISAASEMVAQYLEYIPVVGDFVGSLLEGVMDMIICVMAMLIGCGCGLLVISIVWFATRPFMGSLALMVVLILFCSAYLAWALGPSTSKANWRFGKKAKQQAWGESEGEVYPAYGDSGEQQPLLQDQQEPTYA